MIDAHAHHQHDRATEIVLREAAQFIQREAGNDSLITVIRAESDNRGDHMKIFVSVYPTDKIPSALQFLERQREAFSEYLKQHARIRLPRVDFLLDNEPPL